MLLREHLGVDTGDCLRFIKPRLNGRLERLITFVSNFLEAVRKDIVVTAL